MFAFGGFLIMLAAALYFEQNARRLGRAGIQQLSQTMRAGGLRNALGGDRGPGLRDRLRRDDEPEDPSPTSARASARCDQQVRGRG